MPLLERRVPMPPGGVRSMRVFAGTAYDGADSKDQSSPRSRSDSTPPTSCRCRCAGRTGPSASTWNVSLS